MTQQGLEKADWRLALAGLIGLVLGVWLLPRQHPDSVLGRVLSAEDARHQAIQFLQRRGYRADTTQAVATLRRATDLLHRWQERWGRPALVQQLNAMPWLPAYRWVVYRPAHEADGQSWQVVLAGDGTIWAFRGPEEASGADPDALSAAGIEATAFDPSAFKEAGWSDTSSSEMPAQPGPAAAVALARYHLHHTIGAALALQPDSVGLLATAGPSRQALVRFRGQAPTGDTVTVEVVVSVTGQLRSLEVQWAGLRMPEAVPFGEGTSPRSDAGFTVHEIQELLTVLTYVLLGIWLLVVFLRRLHRRLLDTQGPLRDAVVGGLAFAMATLAAALPGLMQIPNPWVRGMILLFSALIVGVFSAVTVFLAGSTSDALARDRWPEKLAALTLLRRGQIRNMVVGAALLRGIALGGMLLGITAVLLWLWPRAALRLEANAWTMPWPGGQAVVWLGSSVWLGMLLTYVILAVGSWLPWRDFVRSVGMLTLLLLLVSVSTVELEQMALELGLHALWGVVLGWAFWRYEPVCCGVGVVTAWLLWQSASGWMGWGGPFMGDAWLVWGVLGFGAALGLVGLRSQRSEKELPRYIPAYLKELARQERLERELEIARQAQASLLPRALPEVPGVTMAALCQPAYEVGGDYYDVFALPDGRLAVVVGDVSGKGIQAAFFMTLIKGHVRALSLSVRDPVRILAHLNQLFREQAPRGVFVTMIYGVLDPRARTFTMARAGHPPVLHYQALKDRVQCHRPPGMGIGLASTSWFQATIEGCTLHLEPGDRILLYTDGLPEIAGAPAERWGTERLQQWLIQSSRQQQTPEQALASLHSQLQQFAQTRELADDLTAILLEINANP
ncbi:PP2C family protein-serine/threonine phosphatase [Rhodothermus profundi]|uniref:Stage II sporulation protein E (SpoIIE) n=1 Tax=Rhodothermus profundi TaxID=633813 RepID=A0A1M6TDJ1_9BACT|nr:PP2C family protein-serine/threonine phosphatase [Rhodothermus profundi]SHK55067.1 Stage II sporulation protein E (SpoIIE) [Rhodothermus profundi]